MSVETLLQAVEYVRPLLSAPQVAEGWYEPSALPGLTVGALATHLAYAVVTVDSHLDGSPTEGAEPIDVVAYYLQTLHGEETSTWVRDATAARDGERALAGPQAILSSFDEVRERLATRLLHESPDRLMRVPIRRSMRLEEFMTTRVLEVVVHADDLAASVGLPTPSFPEECGEVVIALLVEMSRRRHGDTAVIRAFTRTERDDVQALHVF